MKRMKIAGQGLMCDKVLPFFIAVLLIVVFPFAPVFAQMQQPVPPDVPEGVEFFENEGHEHIPENSMSFFKTDPPTSGPHSVTWLPPSIYEAHETTRELLVHNLEHGNIVIYFNRALLSDSEMKWLSELTHQYLGQWDGMLMVARDDKEHPLILTAWRAMLRMKAMDQKKVLKFVEAFRGRGPENPVR